MAARPIPELVHGPMREIHRDRGYRAMLLAEGLKPVFRISNLTEAETDEELAFFRARGFAAAPCHEPYRFNVRETYDFSPGGADAGPLYQYIFVSSSEASLAAILEADRAQKGSADPDVRRAATFEIGRQLGYPRCCTERYLSYSGRPHQTAFSLRPYQSTVGAPSALNHPMVRLLGHFP